MLLSFYKTFGLCSLSRFYIPDFLLLAFCQSCLDFNRDKHERPNAICTYRHGNPYNHLVRQASIVLSISQDAGK